jgi:hypothetical protein
MQKDDKIGTIKTDKIEEILFKIKGEISWESHYQK